MAQIDGDLPKIMRAHLPMVHWQRIETGGTGKGIPDSNGCWRGHEFWVESKLTEAWAVNFEPEQIGWLGRRARAGGAVFVGVRRRHLGGTRRGAAVDELWLYHGEAAAALQIGGLRSTVPLVMSEGGPARWDWAKVLGELSRDPVGAARECTALGIISKDGRKGTGTNTSRG